MVILDVKLAHLHLNLFIIKPGILKINTGMILHKVTLDYFFISKSFSQSNYNIAKVSSVVFHKVGSGEAGAISGSVLLVLLF